MTSATVLARRSILATMLLLSSSVALGAEPSEHRMDVSLRGPLAIIDVTRSFKPSPSDQHASEVVVDMALPRGAQLLDVELLAGAHPVRGEAVAVAAGRDRYLAASASRNVKPADLPFDDDAELRLRVLVPPDAIRPVQVRYRMSVLPTAGGGRWRVRMPPALDPMPLPVEVVATADGWQPEDIVISGVTTSCPSGRRRCVARGQAGPRSGWELSWAPRRATASGAHSLQATAAVSKSGDGLFAAAIEHRATGRETAPERVLLLVDRSRSVGLPGLAAERDAARMLLERLPPHTRFDAVFYARDVLRLFQGPRTATRQALSLLDEAMSPAHLDNGTDVVGALRAVSRVLKAEAGLFGPSTLLVLITDGALPEGQDGAALAAALDAPEGLAVSMMTLVTRAPDDDPVTAEAREALQTLVASVGGVAREVDPRSPASSIDEALAALGNGGDAFNLRVLGNPRPLTNALAPNAVALRAARLVAHAERNLVIEARAARAPLRARIETAVVEAAALRPHVTPPPRDRLWIAALSGGPVALFEPVAHPATAEPEIVRGNLERSVLRDALALAFLPRARACYQTRPSATPEQRDLAGRVRLAIDVNRGEVLRSSVEYSSLGGGPVELCLQRAAFEVEMPRAYRNDQWVTAILNLSFKPRPPERERNPGEGIGAEIDVILEDLHRSEAEAAGADAARRPDRGAPAPAPGAL